MPVSRDKMGETYADLHRDWERISQVAYAEEDAFRQTLRAGTTIFDLAAAEREAGRRHAALGRPGVRAARHLRLPDRPHPRDGGRAGARGRRGGLPPADGPSSASGPRPTRGPRRASTRDARRLPRGRRRARPPVEFTGYDEVVSEGVGARPRRRRRARSSTPRARATRSSWCSTAPRSTPRAAASSPTRASIELDNGARVEVRDVQSPITGLIVHTGQGARAAR